MNIAYITTPKYVNLTLASIASVCNTNIDTDITFYIIGVNLSGTDMAQFVFKPTVKNKCIKLFLLEQYKSIYDNVMEFSKNNTDTLEIGITKMYLPLLLPNVDKLIFLDSDTIIRKSLMELWNINISNKYIAAVKDFVLIYSPPSYRTQKSIKQAYHFFSGQLLMNLKLLREKNILSNAVKIKLQNYKTLDEELFNEVIPANMIEFLPVKYCVNPILALGSNMLHKNIAAYNKVYNCGYLNITELLRDAVILHCYYDKKRINEIDELKRLYDRQCSIACNILNTNLTIEDLINGL